MQIIKLNKKTDLFKLPSKHGWWIEQLTGKQRHRKDGYKEEIVTRSINFKIK